MYRLPHVEAVQISKESFEVSIGKLTLVCAGIWCELLPYERRQLVTLLLLSYGQLIDVTLPEGEADHE